MNLVLLLLSGVILIFILYIFKDFISPPIIMAVSWIIPIVFVALPEMFRPNGYAFNEYSLIFILGIIVFSIGFYFVNKKVAKNTFALKIKTNYKPTAFIYLFFILEIVIFIIFIKQVNSYVDGYYKYNYWFTYKWGVEQGEFKELAIMPFMRAFCRVLACTLFVSFLSSKKLKHFIPFLIQLIITFFYCVLGQGRGGLFAFIIPLFIIYLILNRKSLKTTLKNLIRLVFLLSLIFTIYTYIKSPYKITNENFLLNTIENYLGGSIVSFCNWVENFQDYSYGTHSFIFFFKLLSAIGFNVPVVDVVQEYVENLHGNVGNVYTFYHWYAQDFGIIYSLLIQFFIGVFHGILYKKVYEKKNYFYIILHALFFYPLIMQFFMDEYSTMLSLWIQSIIILYILLNTNIFFTRVSGEGDEIT